jgi:hypothetical protein
MGPQQMAEMRQALVRFAPKPHMVKAKLPMPLADTPASSSAVVLPYKARQKRGIASHATLKLNRDRSAVAAAR